MELAAMLAVYGNSGEALLSGSAVRHCPALCPTAHCLQSLSLRLGTCSSPHPMFGSEGRTGCDFLERYFLGVYVWQGAGPVFLGSW